MRREVEPKEQDGKPIERPKYASWTTAWIFITLAVLTVLMILSLRGLTGSDVPSASAPLRPPTVERAAHGP